MQIDDGEVQIDQQVRHGFLLQIVHLPRQVDEVLVVRSEQFLSDLLPQHAESVF